VAVHTAGERPQLALGKSDWFATMTGNEENALSGDGQPHSIVIFASTELLVGKLLPVFEQLPANSAKISGMLVPLAEPLAALVWNIALTSTRPAPLAVSPGQQVDVVANLFHMYDPGNENEHHAPVLAATATQTVTVTPTFDRGGHTPDTPGPARPSPWDLPTRWSGTWTSGGTSVPADLTLSSVDPLTGTLVLQGLCTAAWTEIRPNPDGSRLVQAHITSGGGGLNDNYWNVTISANRLSALTPPIPARRWC
jgi:hypothetical protein